MPQALCPSRDQELTSRHPLSASSTHAEIFKSQYRVIGEGCFGCVKLAYHRLTGTPVAVKVQQKGRRDPVIASEISIMKTLYHPNIIRLFQVMETVDHVYLVMEHVNGQQLQQHIIEAQRLCEEEARGIFKQLVCAVKYCHDGGIVHRDLKADNILLDAQGKAKVTDFGLGTRYSFGQSLTDWCGAFRYWALELFLRLPYDGRKVDVWSLGIVLYYMVTGALPFTGETVLQVRWAVLKLRYDIPRYLSMGLRNIIVQMLTKNPSERPSLDHIVGHPWLRQGEEGSPSPAVETLPKRLDPAILAAMCDLGYYPGDIYQSLLQRKFDEAMATYLLLREQVCQRIRFNACIKPPVCPEIVPTPSRRPFHLRSSTKEESQCTCPSSNFTLSSEDEKAGHRGRRRSSMPNIAISILPRRIPTTGVIPQPGPEAVTPPRNVESGMFCEGMSSKEHAFTGGQPHDGVATSISDNIPDWKRVRRRIVNAILSLCCCVWGQNSQPQFHNTVAPNKSTDS